MLVVIGGKVYDPDKQPILVVLEADDKERISKLPKDYRFYLGYPDGTPKQYMWDLLGRWEKLLELPRDSECSCDDIGDDPCPVHARENQLQDQNILIMNILKKWERFIKFASFSPPWKEYGREWFENMKEPVEHTLMVLGKCLVTRNLCEDMPTGEEICGCKSCEAWRQEQKEMTLPPDPVGDVGEEGPQGMGPTPTCQD